MPTGGDAGASRLRWCLFGSDGCGLWRWRDVADRIRGASHRRHGSGNAAMGGADARAGKGRYSRTGHSSPTLPRGTCRRVSSGWGKSRSSFGRRLPLSSLPMRSPTSTISCLMPGSLPLGRRWPPGRVPRRAGRSSLRVPRWRLARPPGIERSGVVRPYRKRGWPDTVRTTPRLRTR